MTTSHPRAHYWRVMKCGGPNCRHPHLALFDEDDNLIADAVIDRDLIDKLSKDLRAAVDEIDDKMSDNDNAPKLQ